MVAKTDQKARLFDLTATLLELLRDGKRDPEEVANILQAIKDGRKLEFAGAVTTDDTDSQLSSWRQFLNKELGVKEVNPRIPDRQSGFDRLIVVPKGIKPSQIITAMRRHIKVCTYESLDFLNKVVSDRPASTSRGEAGEPAEDYAIWIRSRQEADEELKNLSAIQLKKKGIKGITLTEQLLNAFFYWHQHKDHLDKENWTLCAGSRGPDGYVPDVGWGPYCGEVDVGWCGPDEAFSGLRCREAVS